MRAVGGLTTTRSHGQASGLRPMRAGGKRRWSACGSSASWPMRSVKFLGDGISAPSYPIRHLGSRGLPVAEYGSVRLFRHDPRAAPRDGPMAIQIECLAPGRNPVMDGQLLASKSLRHLCTARYSAHRNKRRRKRVGRLRTVTRPGFVRAASFGSDPGWRVLSTTTSRQAHIVNRTGKCSQRPKKTARVSCSTCRLVLFHV